MFQIGDNVKIKNLSYVNPNTLLQHCVGMNAVVINVYSNNLVRIITENGNILTMEDFEIEMCDLGVDTGSF